MTAQEKRELRLLFKKLQGAFHQLKGWKLSFPVSLTVGRSGGFCNRKSRPRKLEIRPHQNSSILDMKIILVHEVTHALTHPDHDSIFFGLLRRLLKRWIGTDGYTLVRDSVSGRYLGLKTETTTHDLHLALSIVDAEYI